MKLRYNTLRRIKDVENWIDIYTATEISKKLTEIITQARNGIILDEYEKMIYDALKSEVITGTEKEKDKELIKLRGEVEALKIANNILREKNKQLTAKLI